MGLIRCAVGRTATTNTSPAEGTRSLSNGK